MHFALPQRKSSVRPPPTYAIRPNGARRTRPAFVILTIVGILSALWLLAKTLGTTRIPSTIKPTAGMGGPRSAEVVLVTVFDETTDAPIQEFVKKNRMNYAEKHGSYIKQWFRYITDNGRLCNVLPGCTELHT